MQRFTILVLTGLMMSTTIGCGAPKNPTVEKPEVHATWLTDFAAAQKVAAETGRPIVADFSGSDWCGWCIKLESEVFSQQVFQKYAQTNVVLFLADFPSRKELPPKVKAQNEKLAEQYAVNGFPTVLVLDASGKVLGRTGYQPGGPEAYVAHLKELIAKAKAPTPTPAPITP